MEARLCRRMSELLASNHPLTHLKDGVTGLGFSGKGLGFSVLVDLFVYLFVCLFVC